MMGLTVLEQKELARLLNKMTTAHAPSDQSFPILG